VLNHPLGLTGEVVIYRHRYGVRFTLERAENVRATPGIHTPLFLALPGLSPLRTYDSGSNFGSKMFGGGMPDFCDIALA
jgi:hypothetical protein